MKRTMILAASLLITAATFAQTWTVDPVHSRVGFAVTHLTIAEFQGDFTKFSGTITSAKEDFSDAVVEFSTDAASVDTRNGQRDKHLQSPDFFDVAQYPSFTFKSTSFKKVKGNEYKVEGSLTMHGVTKPVVLTATLVGTTTNQQSGKKMAGFKVTGVIKRSDFGIASGMPAAMLSDEVKLDADLEFSKD